MAASTAFPLPARTGFLALLVVACGLLASCVTSLYPLSENPKDFIYRSDLRGVWQQSDGDAYVQVAGSGDTAYALTLVEVRTHDDVSVNDTSYFIGRLLQKEGSLFLDCVVDLERQLDYKRLGDYTRAGLAPTHFLFHLSLRDKGDVMELGQLQAEGLEKVLRERYPRTLYRKDGESILLVEPPSGLASLLVQLLKEPSVWEKSTWTRKQGQ